MRDTTTILLVEDDKMLLNSNRLVLEREGYSVLTAQSLSEARKVLNRANLIVLDIVLPDGSGLDFLKELRRTSSIPVLLLTALDSNTDIMNGLETGGDDYLTKPFDVGVLRTRIKALLRRATQLPETLEKGPIKLEITSGQAFLNGKDMLLTQKQFSLLLLFTQNEGQDFSAEYLYKKVWGQDINNDDTAVRNTVYRIRKKLSGSGYTISSKYGEGYCFEKI